MSGTLVPTASTARAMTALVVRTKRPSIVATFVWSTPSWARRLTATWVLFPIRFQVVFDEQVGNLAIVLYLEGYVPQESFLAFGSELWWCRCIKIIVCVRCAFLNSYVACIDKVINLDHMRRLSFGMPNAKLALHCTASLSGRRFGLLCLVAPFFSSLHVRLADHNDKENVDEIKTERNWEFYHRSSTH